MKITNTEDAELFVEAKFAKLNKQETLAAYRREVHDGCYSVDTCKVVKSVRMTREEWREFTVNLLTDFDWLAGEGGHDTTAELPTVEHWWNYTEEQQTQFRAHAYRLVLAVSAPDCATIYVDPQGYDYARHVGI